MTFAGAAGVVGGATTGVDWEGAGAGATFVAGAAGVGDAGAAAVGSAGEASGWEGWGVITATRCGASGVLSTVVTWASGPDCCVAMVRSR